MRHFLMAIAVGSLAMAAQPSTAQDIDSSIIRAVGAVCGAGFETEIQERLDERLNTMFSGIGSSGESSLNAGQASAILETLSLKPENEAIASYATCVLQTLQSVVTVSDAAVNLQTGREVIHSNLVPDPLAIMQSGDRFQVKVGASRAVGAQTLLFSLDKVDDFRGRKYVSLTVSDMMTGQSKTPDVSQGQVYKLNESCSLNPYSIKTKERLVSFLVVCQ